MNINQRENSELKSINKTENNENIKTRKNSKENKELMKLFREKYNESLKDISEELLSNKLVKNDYNFYRAFAEIMLDI